MNCPKCGQLIPTGDKHCVYCGASTGLLPFRLLRRAGEKLPIWVKLLGTVAFLGVVATTALMVGNSDNADQGGNQNGDQRVGTHMWILSISEYPTTPVPAPVITSKYISGTEPIIDGVMSHDEWGQPAFTKTFQYTIEGIDGTGYMEGYFMNDNDDLYAAIELKAEDFEESLLERLGIYFNVDIYFDGDNDGIMRPGEDVKRIYSRLFEHSGIHSHYYDLNFNTNEWWMVKSDSLENGKGATTYSDSRSAYTFEFKIPLKSGDPEDIEVEAGNTMGIYVALRGGHELKAQESYVIHVSYGWPTSEGYPSAETYAKLILASGSE